MTRFIKTLLIGLATTALWASVSQAENSANTGQTGQFRSGQFLMCDTASQVAHYLTLVNAEGKTAIEAQLASGKNDKGFKNCGIGRWIYKYVGEHSKFSVGNSNYKINEIVVVGNVVKGVGQRGQPVKQFGFSLISKAAKPAGFAI